MDDQKPFTLNEVQLEVGDSLHIFTDGYADQFGGERGKKYKYKPFKRFLLTQAEKSMATQMASPVSLSANILMIVGP